MKESNIEESKDLIVDDCGDKSKSEMAFIMGGGKRMYKTDSDRTKKCKERTLSPLSSPPLTSTNI